MKSHIKNLWPAILRFFLQLKRPSAQENLSRLQQSGSSITDFSIREAIIQDIPSLTALHVQAWNETYANVKNPPTYATREYQWQQQFKVTDGSWFCLVVQDTKGQFVGFAQGKHFASEDLPDYNGELNKIYLLVPYQRLGIGQRLFCNVAQYFKKQGITSMVLFGTPQNPSCRFHEKMGGKKLYAANGEFHGGYGWTDLSKLPSNCN